MLGGQRTGQTNSTGRGLLEVEEELFAAVELLNDDDGILIRSALPVIATETEIALKMGEEVGIPILFHAIPDASNQIAVIGKLGDLTL